MHDAKKGSQITNTIKPNNRGLIGVAESRIAQETALKEQKCRERLENTAHLLKKSRNPCIGELSPRDEAEFLIPMQKTIKQKMEEDAFREYEKRNTNTRTLGMNNNLAVTMESHLKPRDVAVAVTMRDRRAHLVFELEQIKKAAEYKRTQILYKN